MPFIQVSNGAGASKTLPLAARSSPTTVDSTPQIVRVLLALSLTIGSISALATLFALYWFVKMRRSFRHELILLLIRSDFLKSIVFVIFPIASFAWGNIPSDSAFCQLSGFALAVGIESSDIAVLLIALHFAMYIFRPRSGLYPYRRVAYLAFYLWPVLAASLAFIQGNGYENMGHFCYLHTDRRWERLALSWVPRYIVFAGIVVIYAFIYLYIRKRMGDYGRRPSEAMQHRLSTGPPPMPRLCYNGLIPSTSCSRRTSATDTISAAKDRLPSLSTGSLRPGSARISMEVTPSRASVRWNWVGFTQAQSYRLSRLSTDDTREPIAPESQTLLSPPVAHTHRRNSAATIPPETPLQALHTNVQTGPPTPNALESSPILPLPRASIPSTTADPGHVSRPYLYSTPVPEPPSPAQQTSRNTRRLHLSSLFVYPLVYTLVWLFPFVSHILGYDDDSHQEMYQQDPPHWLLFVSMISLCVQGVVDCAVFLGRETPWRFGSADSSASSSASSSAGNGTTESGRAWVCAALRRRLLSPGRGSGGGRGGHDSSGVGRSREEMLVDGRLARARREGEMRAERERERWRVGKGDRREWWDVYEYVDREDVGYHEDGVVDQERQVPVRQEVG